MLDNKLIHNLFEALNGELFKSGVVGEVGICGGAVMCLVFNARKSTKDVDAIFEPAAEIRVAARHVAETFNVPSDWLNDAAKGFFLSQPEQVNVIEFSNLRVWAPAPRYMLAMKCMSARFDTHDADDVRFLIRHLQITAAEDILSLVEAYYPKRMIPAKTQFFIEELFEST